MVRLTHSLTHNTAILLANNISGALLAFIITAVIGRGLGVEGLGQYSFVVACVAPLAAVADFGMGSLITRDVAQNQAMAWPFLRATRRVLLPIASLLLIATWLATPLLHIAPVAAGGLALVALLIVLDPWYGLYTALFRAFQRMTPIFVVNVGGLALQLILSVIAVAGGAGLIGVATVLVLINVVQLLATWIWWRRYHPAASPGSALLPSRDILRRALPFAIAGILSVLQSRLSFLLLWHLAGDGPVGLYSAASRFVEAGRLVPAAFFGALFPALASLAEHPIAMRRTFIRASGAVTGFAVAFGLAMTLVGGLLIRLVYGPERASFGGAVPVLTVLAWSLIPALLRSVLVLYHYSLGRERFVNTVILLVLIGQLLVGWLLIGRWGAVGAALTAAIVETGGMVCLSLGLRSRAHLPRLVCDR
jgi:O-antigen/teichoic acid export membrane protein